ncbi:cyclic nucleotide-binding domain-containing protein [Ramlibacter sp. G-1-2-2]|uniref:Cyclic nucleotide-binding domain-containing protein n=1 Tax=Ramlibacter agri TaxID=2728837 RepID=A0A848HD18_9BURK|nr:cyclic nucleotide-binding domain-containing protein [Ramlibacter agri]NML45418.1 cyclic nucleotide-binding domain-containing protein [Ramlibacter agri]
MGDLLANVIADLTRPLETVRGVVSIVATLLGVALLIVASLMRTMVRLRFFTAMSNLFLLAGAVTAPHGALVVLYLILFPVNCVRLAEIMRVTRQVEEAVQHKDLSGVWLKPYMKAKRFSAGTVIFRRGDPADALFLLIDGELEWEEIGTYQPKGQLFGEISFFAPDRTRTLTGRCVTDCLVMKIRGDAFKELYFTNPKFAFHVSELIAERLITDVRQLQHKLDTMPAPLEAEQRRQVA